MEEKLKNKILMDISLIMYVDVNEVEYAFNKLNSIDCVIEAINLARVSNSKIAHIAHIMSEILKDTKSTIVNKVLEELKL